MNKAPAIGQPWPEQGGIYAGVIRDTKTNLQWHLLMAVIALAGEWGEYGIELPGEFSVTDGAHNTDLIIAAEPENQLIQSVKSLEVDGHKDFYIPAQKELDLLYINLQDQCEQVYHWSSTQYSAYHAWVQDFENGYTGIDYKVNKRAVRAVRRVLVIE